MGENMKGIGKLYSCDSEGNSREVAGIQDMQIGIDYAEGEDQTVISTVATPLEFSGRFDSGVLTADMLNGFIGKLEAVTYHEPYYIIPVHPLMSHWIKYSGSWGSTNSKRKFRHRNYEKAWRMSR